MPSSPGAWPASWIVVNSSGRNDFIECLKITTIDSVVETFQSSDIAFTGHIFNAISQQNGRYSQLGKVAEQCAKRAS
jgi:hypothetical protein